LQVILFQEQIFERLRLRTNERIFGGDSGQKYEDCVQKYKHSPYHEDTTLAWEDFKANIQPEWLARPVPLVARPCTTSRQIFAAFASSTSRLF